MTGAWQRALSRCAPLATATTLSLSASASPDYPAMLRKSLDLAEAPPCTLCHASADGGDGPVSTSFGAALVKRGLLGGSDAASLDAAIVRMRQDSVDSDGDGARDLDELTWGGDPNHADLPAEPNAVPPQYGCAVVSRVAALSPVAPESAFAALAAGLGVALRRARRRAR